MKTRLAQIAVPAISSLYALPALAQSEAGAGAGAAKPNGVPDNLFGATGIFKTIANILIFLVGAIAVLVIIFGGLRYVTSTGDAGRVKQAKDTILYGVIGVVVALLAYAIVAFVTGTLSVPTT